MPILLFNNKFYYLLSQYFVVCLKVQHHYQPRLIENNKIFDRLLDRYLLNIY